MPTRPDYFPVAGDTPASLAGADPLGDAIAYAVTVAIDDAHAAAISDAEPRADALGYPCPVCDADRYAVAGPDFPPDPDTFAPA
jgi:hypothetical protein